MKLELLFGGSRKLRAIGENEREEKWNKVKVSDVVLLCTWVHTVVRTNSADEYANKRPNSARLFEHSQFGRLEIDTLFSLSFPTQWMEEREKLSNSFIAPVVNLDLTIFCLWIGRDCIRSIEMWSWERKTRRFGQQLFNYVAHWVMQMPLDVKTFSMQCWWGLKSQDCALIQPMTSRSKCG